ADGRSFDVHLPLVGDFQAANALVAAGLAIAAGEVTSRVMAALAGLTGVKGRLERVGERNGALAVVDYAHKSEALAEVLAALRPYATRRLVCVFGCGGDRDRGKRPLMGAIATERADTVIVTDDNPRSEDPAAIRAAILAAAPGAREIGDRATAIRTAVSELGPGDVLVVAGKGHETGQIVGDRVLPFSDHAAIAAALTEALP
ncbi:MAG: glutamate ligase domain-containing protein, partial [Alsobacter sp.]